MIIYAHCIGAYIPYKYSLERVKHYEYPIQVYKFIHIYTRSS